MQLTIVLAVLAVICFGLAVYTYNRMGRMPKNFTKVDYPVPQVSFPFEPLTDLANECAKKFAVYPLTVVPAVKLSPKPYFPRGENALFHPKTREIYFKDEFANAATPEALAEEMMRALSYAWLWQHRSVLLNDLKVDDRTFDACYQAVLALVGVHKPIVVSDVPNA